MSGYLAVAALSATQTGNDHVAGGDHAGRLPSRLRRVPVNPGLTETRLVDCVSGCGTKIRPSRRKGATGLCRACWLKSRHAAGDPAKRDPEEQFAMLGRMLRATAARCKDEDPGRTLTGLLALDRQMRTVLDEVGAAQVAAVGAETVAAELGWSRQRVHQRWGPQDRASR